MRSLSSCLRSGASAPAQTPLTIIVIMSAHFSPETMKFLRGIARHNDREWFEARRTVYEGALKTPMLALIEEINAAMAEFAPDHMRPAHKIMMRIYRDTRFAKDKRPYKTHLAAWWSRRGMEKTSGGGFYLQLGPQEVMVAAGVYMPEREQLLALRRWMAANHLAYRRRVDKLLRGGGSRSGSAFESIDAQALTRMPRGFPQDDAAGELLRARNWGVRALLAPEIALEPQLAEAIVRRFRLAAPLVEDLNGAILSGSGGPA
jgi:uncharacterized protein (TIGR02453 family)